MNSRTSHGVTLIELVIAMATAAIVMVAVIGIVNSQQRAYYDGHRQRAAQASARSALQFMENELLLAGYGLDAPVAFDFDRYAGPCPAEMGGCPRDATANSDEIVFHYRNPRYWLDEPLNEPRGNAWRLLGASPVDLTVNARAGDVFLRGQILQAVCPTGFRFAYATVRDTAQAAAAGALTVPVEMPQNDEPFRRPDEMLSDPCFATGQARLFLVERRRFHVRPVQNAAGGFDPYLVLDAGVDANRDGAVDEADEVIIAEGVEILQFAYVMSNAALEPRGATAGTAIVMARAADGATAGDGMTLLDFPGIVAPGISLYKPTSFYGYSVGPIRVDPHRLTDHQGNIRAVRIALLARSATPAPSSSAGDAQLTPVLNMDALPAWLDPNGNFNRVRLTTAVPLRNMVAAAMPDF
jgi:type IV pilus assembly protein PilW